MAANGAPKTQNKDTNKNEWKSVASYLGYINRSSDWTADWDSFVLNEGEISCESNLILSKLWKGNKQFSFFSFLHFCYLIFILFLLAWGNSLTDKPDSGPSQEGV